jgi:hypothetical protein
VVAHLHPPLHGVAAVRQAHLERGLKSGSLQSPREHK